MADSQKNSRHPRMAVVLGVVLIVLGVFNLAGNVFPGDIWFRLGQIMRALWGIISPSAFVVAGVYLVWASRRGKLAGFTSSSAETCRSAVAWKIAGFWEYAAA